MKFRKHIRLKEFDYSSPNYYFITICTDYRKKLFVPRVSGKYGELLSKDVVAGLVPANSIQATTRVATTNIVESILIKDISPRYMVVIDFYCIMSDHLHFIIDCTGDHKGRNYSLGQIMGAFKSLSTRAVWKVGYKGRLWQPNFYEHVIRSDSSLERIRNYILHNPFVAYLDIPWKRLDPNI